METFFFDTNSLVYWYTFGFGAEWMKGIILRDRRRTRIATSTLTLTEFRSAICTFQREQHVDDATIQVIFDTFDQHAAHPEKKEPFYTFVPVVSPDDFMAAGRLAVKYRHGRPAALHSLDAIQLTSALKLKASLPPREQQRFWLVTADGQLTKVAGAEGLVTLNPLLSPPQP